MYGTSSGCWTEENTDNRHIQVFKLLRYIQGMTTSIKAKINQSDVQTTNINKYIYGLIFYDLMLDMLCSAF